MAASAAAQDPFEIEVYGYETGGRGEWELETHLNYAARGTTTYDGGIAPTEHQTHLALELTRGLTDHWEVAAYVLAAHRPGTGVEYAGWRVRSRVRSPESWRVPGGLRPRVGVQGPSPPPHQKTGGARKPPPPTPRVRPGGLWLHSHLPPRPLGGGP